MAQKRMFSLQIVDTDAFLEMPVSSQLLYFHLSMRADDDGFIGNPKKIMRAVGVQEDDLKVLIAKRFILTFETGIIVIKHWRINNYIQNDRYNETKYVEEKNNLELKDNSSYTERIQDVSSLETQVSIGKSRLDKVRLEGEKTPAEEAKDFFSNTDSQLKVLLGLQNKYGQKDFFAAELKKFIDYWTELNKSGTKERWEQQQTFEVKKRLSKWLNNNKQFNQVKKTSAISI